MRWVKDKDEYTRLFLEAKTCVFIDSGRQETSLQRLTFDDVMLRRRELFDLLQDLMAWSGESRCNFVLLEPDPFWAFFDNVGRYPVFEIAAGDSAQSYIDTLAEELGNDNYVWQIGHLYREYAIASSSIGWFVHALQSSGDDSGHLWIPPEWKEKILKKHSWIRGPNNLH